MSAVYGPKDLHYDWNEFSHPNWRNCNHETELTIVAQNVVTITEKILLMEQLKTEPLGENHSDMIERLIGVLTEQLEKEYEHREKMLRLKMFREVGAVPPFSPPKNMVDMINQLAGGG